MVTRTHAHSFARFHSGAPLPYFYLFPLILSLARTRARARAQARISWLTHLRTEFYHRRILFLFCASLRFGFPREHVSFARRIEKKTKTPWL